MHFQKVNFPKTKTTSLTKSNPYLNRYGYHLPYHYNDPSFTNNYKGLFLKKDVYIQSLLHNRFVPNKNLIKNKKYIIKKNNNLTNPKEILINANFPIKKNNNLFQYYIMKKEKYNLEKNPYIVKYGSFCFGQQTYKPKVNKDSNIIEVKKNQTTFDIGMNTIKNEYKNKLNNSLNKTLPTIPGLITKKDDNNSKYTLLKKSLMF